MTDLDTGSVERLAATVISATRPDGVLRTDVSKMLRALAAERDRLRAENKMLTDAIKMKGGTEHYPTEDAYLAACETIRKEKAEVERLTKERDAQIAAARVEMRDRCVKLYEDKADCHEHQVEYHMRRLPITDTDALQAERDRVWNEAIEAAEAPTAATANALRSVIGHPQVGNPEAADDLATILEELTGAIRALKRSGKEDQDAAAR